VPGEGVIVIRQAVSCDICGTEKRQTNHWFVAYEQSGELRVSGWTSRRRGHVGSKHLCGQTCLHKLVDEFMANTIASRGRPAVDEVELETPIATDTSLTSGALYEEMESSARLITRASRTLPIRALRAQPDLVAMPSMLQLEDSSPAAVDDAPRYSSPSRRAEAWQRERERESRAAGNTPKTGVRQHSLVHRGA
jgi:hypothetical protein